MYTSLFVCYMDDLATEIDNDCNEYGCDYCGTKPKDGDYTDWRCVIPLEFAELGDKFYYCSGFCISQAVS